MGSCFKNNLNFMQKDIMKWLYQTIMITLQLKKGKHVYMSPTQQKKVSLLTLH